jgi:regulator of protease activity HflC (stomatin/prohibitin superfamily)
MVEVSTVKVTATVMSLVATAAVLVGGLVFGGCYAERKFAVFSQETEGRAEYARAEQNRRIQILEAQARQESATLLAQAEVERAKGVAEANRIVGEGLKGHEEYLRYLWVMSLEHSAQRGNTVVYVPTEANLPVLEAGKR